MQEAAVYAFISYRRNFPRSHHRFWTTTSPLLFSPSFQGWFVWLGEGCWLPALLSEVSLGMDRDYWSSPAAGRESCNTPSQACPDGSKWASSPVIWWCQGRAWKCSSAASFGYTSHSLGSQFWPAKQSWLHGAGKKKQRRVFFSDLNPPLLRNTDCFYAAQSLAAKMKLHPLSFISSPPAMVCSLLV